MSLNLHELMNLFFDVKIIPRKIPFEHLNYNEVFLEDYDAATMESLVSRYIHGDCHDMTQALKIFSQSLNLNVLQYAIYDINSVPVHSFLFNGEVCWDLNGFLCLETMLDNWSFVEGCYIDEITFDPKSNEDYEESLDNVVEWLKLVNKYNLIKY